MLFTTLLDCLFASRNHIADAFVIFLVDDPVIQSIVWICFVLNFGVSETITNSETLLQG